MIYYKTENDMETIYHIDGIIVDEWSAKDCADDYHSNHDGWECTWPLEFSLAETEDSREWKTFVIEREYTTVFYAAVKREKVS